MEHPKGYVYLATTDSGYFGKGIYSMCDLEGDIKMYDGMAATNATSTESLINSQE